MDPTSEDWTIRSSHFTSAMIYKMVQLPVHERRAHSTHSNDELDTEQPRAARCGSD